VTCKPGTEEAFRLTTLENARQSACESGIARFDVLQDIADPTKFCLVEVYHTDNNENDSSSSPDENAAAKAHKETMHYLQWRDTVADMMAEPRRAIKFVNHFPTTSVGWAYPENDSLE
jgi:autoinducer 2-degrading protein